MGRLERGLSAAAIIWLVAGCANLNQGDNDRTDAGLAADGTEISTPDVPRSDDQAVSLNDYMTGVSGGEARALAEDELSDFAGLCDQDLPNDMVTKEIYERLSKGDTFSGAMSLTEESAEELAEDPEIQSRIQVFRRERLGFYEDLFECRPGNEEIHELAIILTDNPADKQAFMDLYVRLVETRGEDVLSLFEVEDFNDYADSMLSFFVAQLRSQVSDFDEFYNEGEVTAAIHNAVEERDEELSLLALKNELIGIFGSEVSMPMQERRDMFNIIQNIVLSKLSENISNNIVNRPRSIPISGQANYNFEEI